VNEKRPISTPLVIDMREIYITIKKALPLPVLYGAKT
jgi:hypothetical protein